MPFGALHGGDDLLKGGTLSQEGTGPHTQEFAPLAGPVVHAEDHDAGRGPGGQKRAKIDVA